MHRSLKQATAQPPAGNLRTQQKVFDQFCREYNWERPHQALEMKTPGELYVASSRLYPGRLRQPEYSGEWEVRSVGPCGTMRWRNAKPFVGKVLAGECIGLEPVGDGEWKLWFFHYPLGLWDEAQGTHRQTAQRASKPVTDLQPAAAQRERNLRFLSLWKPFLPFHPPSLESQFGERRASGRA